MGAAAPPRAGLRSTHPTTKKPAGAPVQNGPTSLSHSPGERSTVCSSVPTRGHGPRGRSTAAGPSQDPASPRVKITVTASRVRVTDPATTSSVSASRVVSLRHEPRSSAVTSRTAIEPDFPTRTTPRVSSTAKVSCSRSSSVKSRSRKTTLGRARPPPPMATSSRPARRRRAQIGDARRRRARARALPGS